MHPDPTKDAINRRFVGFTPTEVDKIADRAIQQDPAAMRR